MEVEVEGFSLRLGVQVEGMQFGVKEWTWMLRGRRWRRWRLRGCSLRLRGEGGEG